ncbi:class I adenylate-forming enzyme family protein [Dactylosporangium sucinum]|uniref:AMP-dependent ligase n=1 Tax=Dactylosporangium sucinum TaxID=1424081 RepID=A0A917X012_9ACTN|nr:class I adenylate-forming enzyme family protein [Dactylosporangium sucinum]GGM47039.1 AMP-dependent ligase [Dactylosporangium sucinum]
MTVLHDLLDHTAGQRPDAVAVTDGRTTLTYAGLRDASRRAAAGLHRLGVRRGDRVVVAVPNDAGLAALLYGIARAGAVFAVTKVPAPDVTVAHVLDDAEPALLVTTDAGARALAEARGIPACGPDQLDGPQWTGAGPLPVDPVCFIYTSGSTGMPKAVVSTHAQVVFAATAIHSQLRYEPGDVVYGPLPPSFDYGLYQLFLCTLAGCRLHLGAEQDNGRRLAAALAEAGATVLPAVPSVAINLLRLLRRPTTARPALRLLTNTGAAMPPDVLAGLRECLPGLRVQLMFGLTECKRAAILPPDEDLRRPGATGRALPGTEIYAAGPDGGRLPAGETGELVVRGPHVMAGYWRRPELTAQRFPRQDGLFPQLRTGDHGRVDADGYVYFEGRRDDQYKENGTRVSATEVEAAAYRVPGVHAAGVLPPAATGTAGATLVVVSDLAPGEVLSGLRDQLDALKVPSRCLVVASLPLTTNGKVDRAALAAAVAGDRDAA